MTLMGVFGPFMILYLPLGALLIITGVLSEPFSAELYTTLQLTLPLHSLGPDRDNRSMVLQTTFIAIFKIAPMLAVIISVQLLIWKVRCKCTTTGMLVIMLIAMIMDFKTLIPSIIVLIATVRPLGTAVAETCLRPVMVIQLMCCIIYPILFSFYNRKLTVFIKKKLTRHFRISIRNSIST